MSAHASKAGADRSSAQSAAVVNESGKGNDGSDNGTEPEILPPDTDSNAREIEKEYFKILHKPNVGYDQKERRYKLRYFPRDTPVVSRFVPLMDIKTGHSNNDDHLKHPFAIYCLLVLLMAIACLFSVDLLSAAMRVFHFGASCSSQPDFLSISCVQLVGPALVVLVGVLILPIMFAVLCKLIENNFVSVDAQWQNSIDQFFAPDVYSKMMGIRLCMLKFRQFIKWRRSSNIFLWCFSVLAALLWLSVVVVAAYLESLQGFEILTSLAFLGWLAWVLMWFRSQRRKHTKWRDPTVQLCVMIAELHQRLIDRGATMIEDGGHST
ncbi:MAG: hypothetical protein ABSD21_08390 [Rhizomicrobium sp.]|jgi:hypothetical protein